MLSRYGPYIPAVKQQQKIRSARSAPAAFNKLVTLTYILVPHIPCLARYLFCVKNVHAVRQKHLIIKRLALYVYTAHRAARMVFMTMAAELIGTLKHLRYLMLKLISLTHLPSPCSGYGSPAFLSARRALAPSPFRAFSAVCT